MLDAATEVFSECGYHAASMDEIAARVSVTKPMLYAYFGSKEGLYAATIQRAGNHLVKLVTGLMAESDPSRRLDAGTDAFMNFVFSQRAAWAVVYNERMGPDSIVDVSEYRQKIVDFVARTLIEYGAQQRGAQPNPDSATMAAAMPFAIGMIGSFEALLRWWSKYTPFDQDQCRAYGHKLVAAHARAYADSLG